MNTYRDMKWMLAALLIAGCGQSASAGDAPDCGQGETLSEGGESLCVYRQEIIEEGFDCPPSASYQHDFSGGVVCSSTPQIPDGMQDDVVEQDIGTPTDPDGAGWSIAEPDDPNGSAGPDDNNGGSDDGSPWPALATCPQGRGMGDGAFVESVTVDRALSGSPNLVTVEVSAAGGW